MSSTVYNPYRFGGGSPFMWTHERLLRTLTTGIDPVIHDPLVLNAFRQVDRLDFVPAGQEGEAYADKELPLNYHESMIRPSAAAKLLQILNPQIGGKYLHLGTGSGYFAALLGMMVGSNGKVYTLDRVQWLTNQARKIIRQNSKLNNIELVYRNGSDGLLDKHPFDGIILTYAEDEPPLSLLSQLKINGKLIVPLTGTAVKIIEKTGHDTVVEEVQHDFIFDKGKVGLA